jgi:hypothetical protein
MRDDDAWAVLEAVDALDAPFAWRDVLSCRPLPRVRTSSYTADHE